MSIRHYNDVGSPVTHDYQGNAIQNITVDTVANGAMVAVTSTAKTIEIQRSGSYSLIADADVFYTISSKVPDNLTGTVTAVAATTTVSDNPKLRANERVPFTLEKGDKLSVITATTANLEFTTLRK